MSAVRLDHVSVTTADLDASIAFYRDLLGLPLVDRGRTDGDDLGTLTGRRGATALWAELALGGGQVLELMQYVEPIDDALEPRNWRPGATHVGLAVRDLDAVLARLAADGVPTSEPVELTEPGWDGVRCAYAADPDGVSIELLERPRARVVVLPEADTEAGEAADARANPPTRR